MILVKGKVILNTVTKTAEASFFSDTKSEITALTVFPGIPEGYTVEAGSSVMTAEGELGFFKSDGTLNWL